ncbi:ATP-binding protein [Streptacidiphilus sp. PAMC 29251]
MTERGLYEREDLTAHGELALESLSQGLASGATDLGSVLLFSGEAGLGKTSLLAELRRSAAAAGCTVLYARGGEQQRNVPFHVVRQLMQTALARLTPDQRHELEAVSTSWYAIAAPAMGAVAPTAGTLSDPQGVRDALDFVVTQLAFLQRPLAIVVDDLHWADTESLTWLASFAARVPVLPMLLALAFRPEELEPAGAPLLDHRIATAGGPLELRALSPGAVEALVLREFGAAADPMFARECWHVTTGNPYLLVTLFAKLKDRKLKPVEETVPLMRELVAAGRGPAIVRRLERLGTDTHWFAYAAAILDNRIDPDVAGRVAGISPSAARNAIDRLREDRILREEQDELGRTVLEFVHPTIATAIYQSVLLPSIRTAMHGQAAVEVIASGRSLADASRHLLEIQPDEDLRMVEQLREAARQHLTIGSPEAAKRCLERALREPPADEDRAELLFELGCSTLLTAPPVTINHLRSALTTTPGLRPDHREQAVLRLGQALGHSNQMEEAVRVTLEEITRLPAGLGRTRLEAASFMWQTFLRDEPDAQGRSQQLAALSAGLSGTDSGARAVRVLRAFDLTQRGEQTTEALDLAASAFDRPGRLAEGLGWTNSVWGFEIPVLLGLTYIYNDRLDLAAELFNDAANEYTVAGWSGGHLAFANFMRGLVAFRWGRLTDAEEVLRDTLAKSDRLGRDTPLQWDVVGVLCDTLLAMGRGADAFALAKEYSFQPPFPSVIVLPDAPTTYGRLLLAAGRREEGEAQLAKAGEQLDARGWHNTVWAPWAGPLAESVADRDPARARVLTSEALKRAERIGTNSAVGTALRWCAAVSEPRLAVELLAQAVDKLGQSPAAYEYALALVDQGTALRRVGRPGDAAEALEQGIELALQCGADGLARRGRTELLATGGIRHRLRLVAARILNKQEHEAAVRVAQGVPQQRIAEELGISETEAGRLLASAYRKVGTGPDGLATALGLDPDAEPEPEE